MLGTVISNCDQMLFVLPSLLFKGFLRTAISLWLSWPGPTSRRFEGVSAGGVLVAFIVAISCRVRGSRRREREREREREEKSLKEDRILHELQGIMFSRL